MAETPASLGYRMPAEWERHEATWLSWPKDPNTFPPDILPKVEEAFVSIVDALGKGEEVRILVDDSKTKDRVERMLDPEGAVSFQTIKTVDVWVRDYGPTCVRGKDVALVKWRFNAWGNKYEDLLPDEGAGDKLASSTGLRVFRPGVVLEGGSIDANGNGTIMTTEQCLLNPNRNPALDREALEKVLEANLGVSNFLWLKKGIEGDDTDGHIDDIARFVGPGKVAIAEESRGDDKNAQALEENRRLLESSTDERGRALELLAIPMPRRLGSADGRLPASHLNFYIGNVVVLVPTFGGESDKAALKALRSAFPEKDVVGVDCRALVYGLGTVHCVTQQVPAP